ncbi:hypothetical protein HPO96_16750 [Kribbella sandramycini]|uniref:Ig-like domain-containing protein n=1 Tax=Kribbella sandramycini TaxID=60450 RepID=A0A7Y4NZD0_9ACTN|nr:hypothetical protein [Kribbella sandramycini]MBB6565634.1 hypothetical protein [Kribbella sandramycini]NOL41897.1 hypothetical protein [Kribbella sandramycini]
MKTVRAVLALSLAGTAFGVAPAAHAADPAQSVSDVRLSRSSVSVSSLNTVPITIEVDGKFPGWGANETLHVDLERAGGKGRLDYLYSAELTRYEGTVADGKYRGVLHVPSTANGTFQVDSVITSGTLITGEGEGVKVVNGRKIDVTGTNQPRITAKALNEPSPVSKPYTIRWSVINDQTGKPYGSKIKVGLNQDTGCGWNGGATLLTDTAGYITRTYPAANTIPLTCLVVPGNPMPIAKGWADVKRIPGVSATPARTSAPVGTKIAVKGAVTGGTYQCKVHLQRLYGATQWRSVGNTALDYQKGSYTLTAQPAYKGNIPYRVLFPACNSLVTATSKQFVIRGT